MDETALGRRLRAERRRQALTQDELASLAGVGTRFVSDLENGKPGCELGRACQVAATLGLVFDIRSRSWSDIESRNDPDL